MQGEDEGSGIGEKEGVGGIRRNRNGERQGQEEAGKDIGTEEKRRQWTRGKGKRKWERNK